MIRPDYAGGGFVNLVSSLVEAGGGRPRHAPLRALPANELREARNIVFLVVDGLGDNYLKANGGRGSVVRRRS